MAQLPDDMEVKVTKKGNKPAEIKVKQGVKSWKTTENELGMLPQPAQAYASRLLGRPAMGGMPGMPAMSGSMSGGPQAGAGVAAPMHFELRLDKDGKAELKQPKAIAPNVKQLPGGGFQIEIREEGEEAKPKDKKPDPGKGAGPNVKVLPGGGIQVEIREGAEGKSPSDKPRPNKEEEVRRLRNQEQELRKALEELRNAVEKKRD